MNNVLLKFIESKRKKVEKLIVNFRYIVNLHIMDLMPLKLLTATATGPLSSSLKISLPENSKAVFSHNVIFNFPCPCKRDKKNIDQKNI